MGLIKPLCVVGLALNMTEVSSEEEGEVRKLVGREDDDTLRPEPGRLRW